MITNEKYLLRNVKHVFNDESMEEKFSIYEMKFRKTNYGVNRDTPAYEYNKKRRA
jgi:hypothetical protein